MNSKSGSSGSRPRVCPDACVEVLSTEIPIYVGGVENTRIHTSCSQPIGPGLIGGDFLVVEGQSLNGGPLCPLESLACGECAGEVTELTLEYHGLETDACVEIAGTPR